MDLFEIKLLNEFNSRHLFDHDSEAWIRTAMSFLDEKHSIQKGNIQKAADLLASSEWSQEGLNVLAYASLCFWHRPLAVPKDMFASGSNDADWEANARISSSDEI